MIDLFFSLITDSIFIMLLENDIVVKKFSENNSSSHSENFVKKIGELMKKENFHLKDVNNIFFISGPGGQTGERISFSFAFAIKIVNPEIKIFFLDSLSFQAGNNVNFVSIITVGRNTKKYFLNVYQGGEKILKKERIEKFELDLTKEEYENFDSILDFENIDFFEQFLLLKNKFMLFHNY